MNDIAWAKALPNDKAWELLTKCRDRMIASGSKDYFWKDVHWLKNAFDKNPDYIKYDCAWHLRRQFDRELQTDG